MPDLTDRIAEILEARGLVQHAQLRAAIAEALVDGLVLTAVPISYPPDKAKVRWWATASQWRGEDGEWEWRIPAEGSRHA